MGEIEWAMWANEQAIISAVVTLIGAIIGVVEMFRNWGFAAFSLAASVLIIIFEWPRGKRKKGNTIERKLQQYLTPLVSAIGPLGRNYYVRFVAQILMSVPMCFILPTIIGGMCLMISAIIYLVAAVKGEEWKPVTHEKPKDDPAAKYSTGPPTRPPPRPPKKDADATNGHSDGNTNVAFSGI